jgi:hypothetical protein
LTRNSNNHKMKVLMIQKLDKLLYINFLHALFSSFSKKIILLMDTWTLRCIVLWVYNLFFVYIRCNLCGG